MNELVIVDYGAGNVASVVKAFRHLGVEAVLSSDAETVARAGRIVVPGQGAFFDCMTTLRARGLYEPLREAAGRVPFLGICLGLQLLFDESDEHGVHEGLGLLRGRVEALSPVGRDGQVRKVPHVGFNAVTFTREHAVLRGLSENPAFYFVHSYAAKCAEAGDCLGTCEYGGEEVTAAVARDNLVAVQFHPEKSSREGLALLQRFVDWQP